MHFDAKSLLATPQLSESRRIDCRDLKERYAKSRQPQSCPVERQKKPCQWQGFYKSRPRGPGDAMVRKNGLAGL